MKKQYVIVALGLSLGYFSGIFLFQIYQILQELINGTQTITGLRPVYYYLFCCL